MRDAEMLVMCNMLSVTGCRIQTTTFSHTMQSDGSKAPKTPYLVQKLRTYLLYKPSYRQFSVKVSKFPLPWQRGLV